VAAIVLFGTAGAAFKIGRRDDGWQRGTSWRTGFVELTRKAAESPLKIEKRFVTCSNRRGAEGGDLCEIGCKCAGRESRACLDRSDLQPSDLPMSPVPGAVYPSQRAGRGPRSAPGYDGDAPLALACVSGEGELEGGDAGRGEGMGEAAGGG
jgi:hypothetical protein